jgi:hypothetical protein
VRADAHEHVEVPGLPPAPPGRAFAGEPLRRASDRSRWDPDRVAALAVDEARPFAGWAADARHLAGPAAPHALPPRGEEARLLADDPLAAAAVAGDQARAGPFGAGAEAGAAVLRALEGDRLLAPQRRLLEVDLQRVAHVAPGGLAPAREPEQVAEERVEELGGRGDVRAAQRPGPVDGSETIIVTALLLVGEHRIGDR